MSVKHHKRYYFIKLLEEIAEELSLEMKLLCQNRVIRLSDKQKTMFIMGYNFGLNSDACAKICTDKTALYDILSGANIPAVEHTLFHLFDGYHQDKGNRQSMISFFEKNNNKIVIKPNQGTGGIGVEVVETLYEMERYVHNQLNSKDTLCFSPFLSIQHEYRVVMLDNTPCILFKKVIPSVVGDGISSLQKLLQTKYGNKIITSNLLRYLEKESVGLQTIIDNGKTFSLHRKHNLGKGASATLLPLQDHHEIIAIAKAVTKTLNSRFVSVDIIQTTSDDYMVLEVNAGVMLVNFSLTGEKERQLAKQIYTKAIQKALC